MASDSVKQIITYGTNAGQQAFYPVNNKSAYQCANSSITRGITLGPSSLEDCFSRFPGISYIAKSVGFIKPFGATGYTYSVWTGPTGCPPTQSLLNAGGVIPVDTYFDTSSEECLQTSHILGNDWIGCLWGTPNASYSCACPEVATKYEAYVKLRLNDASFWATPVETPVKRTEFVDAIQYGRKVDLTIAGDFNIKVGQVINLRTNGISGFPFSNNPASLNGYYYITGIKHVITNSGTHEMALALTQIPPDVYSPTGVTTGYYS
jgi:hypothetical protein